MVAVVASIRDATFAIISGSISFSLFAESLGAWMWPASSESTYSKLMYVRSTPRERRWWLISMGGRIVASE